MATTGGDPSRRGPRRAPIATLAALLALAGGAQALAPASALAMTDQQQGGDCVQLGDQGFGWDPTTGELCSLGGGAGSDGGSWGGYDGGSGDGSGGGSTSGSDGSSTSSDGSSTSGSDGGSTSSGEVIYVTGTAPTEPSPSPCRVAALCMPSQSGPGNRRTAEPGEHRSPSGGSRGASKPAQRPLSKAQRLRICAGLGKDSSRIWREYRDVYLFARNAGFSHDEIVTFDSDRYPLVWGYMPSGPVQGSIQIKSWTGKTVVVPAINVPDGFEQRNDDRISKETFVGLQWNRNDCDKFSRSDFQVPDPFPNLH